MATRTRLEEVTAGGTYASEEVYSIDIPGDMPMPSPAEAPPPTIRNIMDLMGTYLLAQYPDSVPDQEAVHDAARMLDDGHVAVAWRHLARLVDGVLNVPPGT